MNDPVPYQGGGAVAGEVITPRPAATANAQQSAVYKFGELMKGVLHRSVGVFHNEADLLDALNIVDAFVKTFVPASVANVLSTGEQMAPREDVSLRIPPNQGHAPVPAAPGLDYDKLAAAILRVQQAQQAQEK